jgi:hypothetical protein
LGNASRVKKQDFIVFIPLFLPITGMKSGFGKTLLTRQTLKSLNSFGIRSSIKASHSDNRLETGHIKAWFLAIRALGQHDQLKSQDLSHDLKDPNQQSLGPVFFIYSIIFGITKF